MTPIRITLVRAVSIIVLIAALTGSLRDDLGYQTPERWLVFIGGLGLSVLLWSLATGLRELARVRETLAETEP